MVDSLPETQAIIVLHDSVMATSFSANRAHLDGQAGVVHMLMNESNTVIVAQDMPHSRVLTKHFKQLGCRVVKMTSEDHDILMARTQAPFALLCKSLLPFLHQKEQQGLLTPSGTLLAETLRARELAWTEATMSSILRNPQIEQLLEDIKRVSEV